MASQAEAAETVASSSCCGGSGAGHGGGGCSGSKRNAADVSGVGKEFEAMVAASTMAELEKGYVKGEVSNVCADQCSHRWCGNLHKPTC